MFHVTAAENAAGKQYYFVSSGLMQLAADAEPPLNWVYTAGVITFTVSAASVSALLASYEIIELTAPPNAPLNPPATLFHYPAAQSSTGVQIYTTADLTLFAVADAEPPTKWNIGSGDIGVNDITPAAFARFLSAFTILEV